MATVEMIRRLLRYECDRAGSVPKWAALWGIGERYVYDVLGGKTPPGPKILAALGKKRVVSYEDVE